MWHNIMYNTNTAQWCDFEHSKGTSLDAIFGWFGEHYLDTVYSKNCAHSLWFGAS